MIHYEDERITLCHGDALEVLRKLPEDSLDSVVTDPPYGLEFMGKDWDGADGFRRSLNQADVGRDNVFGQTSSTSPEYRVDNSFQQWCQAWAEECLRILKPGGHLLTFGGSRTFHRLACAVEDAGFEIRDSISWLYGSGFPKSLDVSKAIDKAAGAKREVIGKGRPMASLGVMHDDAWVSDQSYHITAPATDDAKRWAGWGTALKPAWEPIIVARKPLIGTVANNVLKHGTGALNIDACRVEFASEADKASAKPGGAATSKSGNLAGSSQGGGKDRAEFEAVQGAGRWPSNVVLDESQAAVLDEQSGHLKGAVRKAGTYRTPGYQYADGETEMPAVRMDSGGASRYFPTFGREGEATAETRYTTSGGTNFAMKPGARRSQTESPSEFFPTFKYQAKAPKKERPVVDGTAHPTVKPLDLMRWLVRLVTPPGGHVLDPFAGSGTTGEAALLEGFCCVLIEREADYLPLIMTRLDRCERGVG